MTATQTVTIRGREYSVEVLPPRHALDEGRPVYRLTGGRGAVYSTMRNRPRPDLIFLIREGAASFGAMANVWLTDRDGTLREVK